MKQHPFSMTSRSSCLNFISSFIIIFLLSFLFYVRLFEEKKTKSVQQNKSIHMINGMIFGIWHVHQDHRIFLVHIVVDQQQAMFDHIVRVYHVFVFLLLHQQIFDYKQQVILLMLVE